INNILNCFFFFSSRRRHTRSKRDWSSDVCSSDLRNSKSEPRRKVKRLSKSTSRTWSKTRRKPRSTNWKSSDAGLPHQPRGPERRSEERRVGKECRTQRGRKQ